MFLQLNLPLYLSYCLNLSSINKSTASSGFLFVSLCLTSADIKTSVLVRGQLCKRNGRLGSPFIERAPSAWLLQVAPSSVLGTAGRGAAATSWPSLADAAAFVPEAPVKQPKGSFASQPPFLPSEGLEQEGRWQAGQPPDWLYPLNPLSRPPRSREPLEKLHTHVGSPVRSGQRNVNQGRRRG